jgi:hypothetical protein
MRPASEAAFLLNFLLKQLELIGIYSVCLMHQNGVHQLDGQPGF